MKKINIMISLIVLMAISTLAISEGDILTQIELDSLDINSLNIPFIYQSTEYGSRYIFGYGYILSAKHYNQTQYIITKPSKKIRSLSLEDYKFCKLYTDMTNIQCNDFAKYTYLFNKGKTEILNKNKLKDMQTQAQPDIPGSLI